MPLNTERLNAVFSEYILPAVSDAFHSHSSYASINRDSDSQQHGARIMSYINPMTADGTLIPGERESTGLIHHLESALADLRSQLNEYRTALHVGATVKCNGSFGHIVSISESTHSAKVFCPDIDKAKRFYLHELIVIPSMPTSVETLVRGKEMDVSSNYYTNSYSMMQDPVMRTEIRNPITLQMNDLYAMSNGGVVQGIYRMNTENATMTRVDGHISTDSSSTSEASPREVYPSPDEVSGFITEVGVAFPAPHILTTREERENAYNAFHSPDYLTEPENP